MFVFVRQVTGRLKPWSPLSNERAQNCSFLGEGGMGERDSCRDHELFSQAHRETDLHLSLFSWELKQLPFLLVTRSSAEHVGIVYPK